MLNKKIILSKIEKNAKEIKSFGVKELTLFGSYAIEEQKENSDIDFLVEFQKERGLFKDYIGLLHFLEDLFNKKIDLGESNKIREELKDSIIKGVKYEAKI